MAVIHRDHLSNETGHTAGAARALLAVGLALVVLGVLAFLGAALWGMVEARDGSSAAGDSAGLLAAGGLAVVAGTVVAAAGMLLGRRAAGE